MIYIIQLGKRQNQVTARGIPSVIQAVKRARVTSYGDGRDAHRRREGPSKTAFATSTIGWVTFTFSISRDRLLMVECPSWIRYFFSWSYFLLFSGYILSSLWFCNLSAFLSFPDCSIEKTAVNLAEYKYLFKGVKKKKKPFLTFEHENSFAFFLGHGHNLSSFIIHPWA